MVRLVVCIWCLDGIERNEVLHAGFDRDAWRRGSTTRTTTTWTTKKIVHGYRKRPSRKARFARKVGVPKTVASGASLASLSCTDIVYTHNSSHAEATLLHTIE